MYLCYQYSLGIRSGTVLVDSNLVQIGIMIKKAKYTNVQNRNSKVLESCANPNIPSLMNAIQNIANASLDGQLRYLIERTGERSNHGTR